MDNIKVGQIAEVCHEAARVLQKHFIGTIPQISPEWDECSTEQRAMVIEGVINVLSGEITTPGDSHESWCRWKYDHGWQWGETKDEDAKTHPLLKPYSALSPADKAKDEVFFGIVKALEPLPHD